MSISKHGPEPSKRNGPKFDVNYKNGRYTFKPRYEGATSRKKLDKISEIPDWDRIFLADYISHIAPEDQFITEEALFGIVNILHKHGLNIGHLARLVWDDAYDIRGKAAA